MTTSPTYQPADAVKPDRLGSELASVLGKNVTRLRTREKINKTKFSSMLGIGRPTLNAIERGTANPRLDLIIRIAEALDVETLDLFASPAELPEAHKQLLSELRIER